MLSLSWFLQIHPQVTLRTRSRGVPITGTPQCTRYTSLTCLICRTLVYRVHQVVPMDIEGKEGPQLPTDDWVEQEIMKSSTGWIEVHIDCLVRNAPYQVLRFKPAGRAGIICCLCWLDQPSLRGLASVGQSRTGSIIPVQRLAALCCKTTQFTTGTHCKRSLG